MKGWPNLVLPPAELSANLGLMSRAGNTRGTLVNNRYSLGFSPRNTPSLTSWYDSSIGTPILSSGTEVGRSGTKLVTDGAASFAGAQSLEVLDNASLETGNVDFFWNCWVNITSDGSTNAFVTKNTGASNTGDYLIYTNGSGVPLFAIFNGSTFKQAVWGSALSTNAWHNVFGWFDSVNQTVNISIDGGTAVSVSTSGFTPTTSTIPFYMGRTSGATTNYLTGSLDAIVFGKSPPGGIANVVSTIRTTLYASGSGLAAKNLTAAQIAAWGVVSGWDFDGPSNLVTDYIGTNTLTNNNGVTYAKGQVTSTTEYGSDVTTTATDLSGNGNNITQSTAANRPVYTSLAENGLPCVQFTAASDEFLQGTFTLNQPCTIWGVFKSATSGGTIFDGEAATCKLYQSGTTWQMNASGAASFASASSQYMNVASNSNLQMGNVDAWLACWVNFTTFTGGNFYELLAKGDFGSNTKEFLIQLEGTGAFLQFITGNGGSGGQVATSSTALSTGTWYFVFTWQDTVGGNIYISVNGAAANSATISATPATTTGALLLGAAEVSGTPADFLNGDLSCVMYGKPPTAIGNGGTGTLAKTIMTALYAGGSGLDPRNLTAAQISAWGVKCGYSFGGPGNLVTDSIGSNTLTNNAAVTYATGPFALNSTITSDSNLHFFAAVFNGANSFLVVDGTQGSVGNAGSNNPGGLTLASVLAGGSYDTLQLCEAGANAAALNTGQIAQIRAYTKQKWGTP
jgi:hypothetical protein